MQKWEGGRKKNEHDFTQRCDLRTELRHDWNIKRPWLVRNFGHLRKEMSEMLRARLTYICQNAVEMTFRRETQTIQHECKWRT